MSPLEVACPRLDDGHVPVESSVDATLLPGSRASTVVISAVANSLFRWAAKTKGAFRNFLLSVVAKPQGENRSPTSKRGGEMHLPVWPMPVPFPEVFTKKVDSAKDWRKILISLEVLALSWLHLGEPSAAPVEIKLGVPLTPQQWSTVDMLRHLSFDSNTPEFVDAELMSRAAAKFEAMEDIIGSLHRSLLSLDDHGYSGLDSRRPETFDDTWLRCGTLVGKLGGESITTAKPVIASRLEFPEQPAFDPVPFFDAFTAELFMHPLDHASRPEDFYGEVPSVSVHGSQQQKVELYKKLAACNRLKPIPCDSARDPFVSGLFTVLKNSRLDRLILDARPPNLLEQGKSFWCGTMGSINGLGDIRLSCNESLCCSGLDLKDFFYQFVVSEQRVIRNALAGSITSAEAKEVFGEDFECEGQNVRVALATLAMGDLLACEFSQSAHLSLCLRYNVMQPGELLTLRTSVPRSRVIAGVIIDDLIVMERLLQEEAVARPKDVEHASERIGAAIRGYEENKLEANIKKSFFNETSCRFWGGEVDGVAGLVRASSLRAWPLMVITMKIAMLGFSSVKLLETLAGAWIAVLTMRRRMFCLLDIIFEPLGIGDGGQIVALSPALQDELCVLSTTFLLATADLRADFLPMISATDASSDCLGAVRATLPAKCTAEFARFSLKKGTWSRLLPPGRAELRAKALLEPDEELPGVGITSHPLWSILARSLKYEEVWVSEVFGTPHINLLELKAFLKEERRLCGLYHQRSCLAALDSQVCLGALVKGRSSSAAINRALRQSLAYPLGSSFHNYYMYFLSEENRADGPSRRRAPDPPDYPAPCWIDEVASGDFGQFDEWIRSLGPEYSLAPFDFRDLDNGSHNDLRPRSCIPSKHRRGERVMSSPAKKAADENKATLDGALLSPASRVDLVSSDCAGAFGDTNTAPGVGVQKPSRSSIKLANDSTTSTTTVTTSSNTTSGALLSPASGADLVPPDCAGAFGSTNTYPSAGVQGPSPVSAPDRMAMDEVGHEDPAVKASEVQPAFTALLESFPIRQFVFYGEKPDLTVPGGLDLFSGCMGVARAMVANGAPWVLTFDLGRSVSEDLLCLELQAKLKKLLNSGAFGSVGMAPICASFSKAVTPPVRNKQFPRGKPGLSKAMRKKVSEGNRLADFCIELVAICLQLGVAYFLENPDTSWMWKQRGFSDYDDPGAPSVFRLCFCRFGTAWRKATRIATSTRLKGLRMMCTCTQKHFALRGFSQVHRKMWTKVAEPYPRGLSRLLGISLCCQAGWCHQKKLDIAGCSRALSLRIGEAGHPGPPRAPRAASALWTNPSS